jgi:DNA-binding transcriptional LysR family regulator
MNERQQRYLLTIAEEGSISKAAKKLYISQPSLSQILINTEKRLGVKLFNRSTSSLTLTYAGEKYMEGLREIRQIKRRLEQQFQEISNSLAGRLSFGITASKGLYTLPAVLPAFQKAYPNIEMEIIDGTNSKLMDDLLNGNVDLAIVNYTNRLPQLDYVELPDEEMILAVPLEHHLARQYRGQFAHGKLPSIFLKEIANEPFIYLGKNHGVRQMVDSMFLSVGINPPKTYEIGRNATAHALVLKGLGITILPDSFLRYTVFPKNTFNFSISDAPFHRKLAICYRKSFVIPASMQSLITLTHGILYTMYKNSTI